MVTLLVGWTCCPWASVLPLLLLLLLQQHPLSLASVSGRTCRQRHQPRRQVVVPANKSAEVCRSSETSKTQIELKGKCIDFSSRVQKKDNLISVRMAYLSLPYDKPNLPYRQLYTHVAIATSTVMTYERLSSSTETVDHCRNWSFSIVLLYSRCERSAVFNAVSAVNCLSAFSYISLGRLCLGNGSSRRRCLVFAISPETFSANFQTYDIISFVNLRHPSSHLASEDVTRDRRIARKHHIHLQEVERANGMVLGWRKC